MGLTYRAVNSSDLAIIATFPKTAEELYFCYPKGSCPLTVAQLSELINQRRCSTVIEKDGNLVGFANFYQWQHCGVCKIGNVIVDASYRQQGIARYLLSVMTQNALDYYQATELQVACFNTNTAALLFYPKIGFVPTGIEQRIDYSGRKVALIHFSKKIEKHGNNHREI